VIQIKDVTKLYPTKLNCSDDASNGSANRRGTEKENGSIHALDHISLDVAAGEWLSIMGPSGSGKSTLVNLIGCLDRATSGEIWLDGQNVAGISSSELNHVRAEQIGFIFQQFHLIPFLTAVENVMLAQYFHSMTDEKEALNVLTSIGLGDRARHLPSQLSGGEQQRVCIARALINDPKIILADEPTGNLDAQNEEIVLRLLREFHRQGRTIVMVTHDPVVARLADRRIELHHGKISSQEIFSMADEEQLDEVLEELWALAEHGEIAEVERMEVHGALPVSLAIERMIELGLVVASAHPPEPHDHKPFSNPCHDALKPVAASTGDGTLIVELTPRGRERAGSVIRRHRLAERLFTDSLAMDSESEIEQQACKFEHILSPEATDKICTFLGHPRTCPHGAPIPPGPCCAIGVVGNDLQQVVSVRKLTRSEMNDR
jgi:putative ABC transport system ATP-binding protein